MLMTYTSSAISDEKRSVATAKDVVKILRWPETLRRRILAGPADGGRVHSIFERALNLLWDDGRLVTLQVVGPLVAPFAAAVSRLPRDVMESMPALRRDLHIDLGDVLLDAEGAVPVDVRMAPEKNPLCDVGSVLRAFPPPEAAPGLVSRRGRMAQRRLGDGIRTRDREIFIDGARGLIGLGEGLTPAGDDCLVGALAVLHRFCSNWLSDESVGRIGAIAWNGTTIVSREFILHALKGFFSEPLLRCVAASSVDEAKDTLTTLAAYGATSGVDTIYGIGLALEALAP